MSGLLGSSALSGPAEIPFTQIAANELLPLFHVETSNAMAGASLPVARTLVIGETDVTQPSGSSLVYVPGPGAAVAMFGPHCILSRTLLAYMANDPAGEVHAAYLYGPSGTAATGTVTWTGQATAPGTISLYVGGELMTIPVAVNDTGAGLQTKIVNAFTAANSGYFSAQPLALGSQPAAGALTCPVEFQSRIAGLMHNNIDLRVNYRGAAGGEATPAGLTVSVTPMAGGTGTPSLSGIAALIGDQNFDFIVCPYNDPTSLAAMQAMLSDTGGRWADSSQAYGHVFTHISASAATLLTDGGTYNNQHITIGGLYGSPTPPWEIAGAFAGWCAQRLKSGAAPAIPLQEGDALLGADAVTGYGTNTLILAPQQTDRFTKVTNEALAQNGISPFHVDPSGAVRVWQAVTTYQFNSSGISDRSYLLTQTMYKLMYILRDLKSFVTQRYSAVSLADDTDIVATGSAVVTPAVVRSALIAHYQQLVDVGVADNLPGFAAGLVVQRNVTNPNRIDVLYDPYVTGALAVFAVLNQFRLQAAA
ncbi:MAG: phage tail sheath subtilisin-like domain-containing protein [Xanthomonadaceae bacterium]|nr:phage tail sheath subtilisin-like domain-containing protein [Xanthomonadaceae bacterium]